MWLSWLGTWQLQVIYIHSESHDVSCTGRQNVSLFTCSLQSAASSRYLQIQSICSTRAQIGFNFKAKQNEAKKDKPTAKNNVSHKSASEGISAWSGAHVSIIHESKLKFYTSTVQSRIHSRKSHHGILILLPLKTTTKWNSFCHKHRGELMYFWKRARKAKMGNSSSLFLHFTPVSTVPVPSRREIETDKRNICV